MLQKVGLRIIVRKLGCSRKVAHNGKRFALS